MKFCLIKQTVLVTDDELQAIADAATIQGNAQVCPSYGLAPVQVVYSKDGSYDVAAGDKPVFFRDAISTKDALGVHNELPAGNVYAEIAVKEVLDNGGAVLYGKTDDDPTVAATATHELWETLLDAAVNLWVDGSQIKEGNQWSKEVADPVESWNIVITLPDGRKVACTDFVLPAWFDLDAAPNSQFNYLAGIDPAKSLKGPFTLAPGGYAIVRQAGTGQTNEVFGETPPPSWKMETKRAKANGRFSKRWYNLLPRVVFSDTSAEQTPISVGVQIIGSGDVSGTIAIKRG